MIDSQKMSVVIGFRNWGLRRLELAVRSLQGSFGSLDGEVIVSDYGSDGHEANRVLIESLGAVYVYTPVDGPWSRSRALNAGFAVSTGDVLVSTDADMIFSPGSMEVIGSLIMSDNALCILLQCRDLPENFSDMQVHESGFNWPLFDQVSRMRPRWGMGGMMAVHRDVYLRIRGLDERMNTYGGEDIDFATRAKRAGNKLLWLDDLRVRMYHMWHPPTKKSHQAIAEAVEAIDYNKNIVYNDKTFVRNIPNWIFRPPESPPLVSVAISTYNRAEYLRESIMSVLSQTMQDFEIIVVDDGSTDDTERVVRNFEDRRIRYFRQENGGIAAARNRATDEARGQYIAVHDDDDLMTPWRLEKHFESIIAGTHGSFGSFVNFDNVSGELKLFASKKLNSGTIAQTGGAPGHGTWLIETRILRSIRYDESLSSGVDNNLALRMVRSGVKLVHTGEIMMLRRMHAGQVTATDEHTQRTSARQTRKLFSFGITNWGDSKMAAERGKDDYVPIRYAKELEKLYPYLPDHLVVRSVDLAGKSYPSAIGLRGVFVEEYDPLTGRRSAYGKLTDAKLADLVELRKMGINEPISARLASERGESVECSGEKRISFSNGEDLLGYAMRKGAEQIAAAYVSSDTNPNSTLILGLIRWTPKIEAYIRELNLEFFSRNYTQDSLEVGALFVLFSNFSEALSLQDHLSIKRMDLVVASRDDIFKEVSSRRYSEMSGAE